MNDESVIRLHHAVEQKNLSAVKASIGDGADVNLCVNRQTSCTKAIDIGDENIISAIIESASFDTNAGNQFGQTPLIISAREGKLVFVRKLLQLGARVDQQDSNGLTSLGMAARFDQASIAQLLIEHGADVNKTTNTGESPLYHACKGNRLSTAKLLMECGSDVNISTNDIDNHPGHTPLMASISAVHFNISMPVEDISLSKQVAIVRLLLGNGCDLHAQDYRGRTALFSAILNNNIIAACLLLEAKFSPNVEDKFGLRPLHWSLQLLHHYYPTVVLLLYGADPDFINYPCGVSKRDVLAMARGIENKSGISADGYRQMIRTLVSALNPWRLETLRNQRQCDEDDAFVGQDEKGILETTLNAAELTLQSCCRYRIRRFLERNTLNKVNKLPIPNSMKLYLNLNFDTMGFHPGSVSALYLAIRHCNIESIQSIMQSGTSVQAPFCGRLPLTLAAELGQNKVVHILLKLGADPNALDTPGESPLHLAARNAHIDVVQTLLLQLPELELRNKELRTPLIEVAFNGDSATFKILLQAGSDPEVSQKDGITPLHYMAGNGNAEIVRYLLDLNVDPDVMDSNGNRPIHIAASKGRLYSAFLRLPALYRKDSIIDHVGVTRALVEAGCDVMVRNPRGRNALDISKAILPSTNPELIRYLTDLFP